MSGILRAAQVLPAAFDGRAARIAKLQIAREPEVAVASGVGVETPLEGLKVAAVRLRPELLFAQAVLQPDQPRTRDQLEVPVSRVAPPTDSVLFESAADPGVLFYLPRYRLRSDGRGELIRMDERDGAWVLTLELEAFAAPELGDVGAAGPLPHTLTVLLQCTPGDGQFERTLAVEPTPEGHWRATLPLPSRGERDVVFRALSDGALRTRLVIRRALSVGVPGAPPPAEPEPELPAAGRVVRDHRRRAVVRDHRTGVRMAMAPRLASLRRFEATAMLSEAAVAHPAAPQVVYRVTAATLDHDERQSFVFPRDLYPDLYAGIGAGGARDFQLVYVPFGDRQHRYLRDPADPRVFHHLPDAFTLGRQTTAPHAPTMVLRFLPGAEGLDDLRAQIDVFAMPTVEPARLADAAARLPGLLGDDPLEAGEVPQFKLLALPREKLVLRLGLPGAAAGPYAVREGARIELDTVVSDQVELALPAFRAAWEALFSATPVLFQGSVEATFADGVEQIPFVARMDRLAGPVIDVTGAVGADGQASATVVNSSESPVVLSGPQPLIIGEAGAIAADVTEPDPAQPIELAPGASVVLRFAPREPVPTGARVSLRFAATEVKLDRDALYDAVLEDETSVVSLERPITVRGGHLFAAATAAGTPLVAALVEFEHGTTAELTPAAMDGEGVVSLPLRDFVLGAMSSTDLADAAYRYRLRLVHATGQERSPDWIEDTTEILYPVAPAPAANPGAPPA
jgi:hypothetical protein